MISGLAPKVLPISSHSSGTRIEIRTMKGGDIDRIGFIERASHPVPWRETMFLSELNSKSYSNIWVAVDPSNGDVVGYICFWYLLGEIHILNLAVHPDFRRNGIGRRLVLRVLAFGLFHGGTRADLEVRASNVSARNLYDGVGFEVVGHRPNYYIRPKEDGLFMVRQGLSNRAGQGGSPWLMRNI